MDEDYLKKLVIMRLRAIPPNVSFSIGSYGNFSVPQLVEQVSNDTDVGRATIKMQLNFLRASTQLSKKLGELSNE